MPNNTAFIDVFPRSAQYINCNFSKERKVRESAGRAFSFPYSERHLQCVWFDSRLRPNKLFSQNGETIIINEPGRWNLEAGPDFLDASITIMPDNRTLKGDVEIHIHPRDWHSHGHDTDPRYSNVIIHASFFPGTIPDEQLPAGTIQTTLQTEISKLSEFSFENIDTSAYPYSSTNMNPRLCARVLNQLPPSEWIDILESAGEERLRRKTSKIATDIDEKGSSQTLYEEIMYSFGYKHNRAQFRQLARLIPIDQIHNLKDSITAYAILLGISGLMPSTVPPVADEESGKFIRQIWDIWWKQQSAQAHCIMPPNTWTLSGIRPQNHPARRISAAASLFTSKHNLEKDLCKTATSKPADWYKQTEAIIQNNVKMHYWEHHLSLSGKRQDRKTAIIGKQRIASMISNIIIPFIAAKGIDITPLLNNLPSEQNNSITKQTAFSLFGHDHNPAVYQTGLRQQGLLQIFYDFCINNDSCNNCQLLQSIINDCN